MGEQEPPILNTMIEDYLAHGATQAAHGEMLMVWHLMGAEYLARAVGRQQAVDTIRRVADFIATAEPNSPWAP